MLYVNLYIEIYLIRFLLKIKSKFLKKTVLPFDDVSVKIIHLVTNVFVMSFWKRSDLRLVDGWNLFPSLENKG